MQLEVWCRTDKGLKRESNQDSFLINHDLGLYIVADGMGGHSGGEVASSMAVQVVEEVISKIKKSKNPPRDDLMRAYEEASRRIFDQAAHKNPELVGMGTTMVATWQVGDSMFIGNVGDSRVYLFRRPHLWQVTEDHSLINEQLRNGMLREDQIKQFVGKNVITRSVGYERDVIADILERPLLSGDCFLLCSDGLSGLVSDVELERILNETPANKVVDRCIEAALKAGGDDNVTALYLTVQ